MYSKTRVRNHCSKALLRSLKVIFGEGFALFGLSSLVSCKLGRSVQKDLQKLWPTRFQMQGNGPGKLWSNYEGASDIFTLRSNLQIKPRLVMEDCKHAITHSDDSLLYSFLLFFSFGSTALTDLLNIHHKNKACSLN